MSIERAAQRASADNMARAAKQMKRKRTKMGCWGEREGNSTSPAICGNETCRQHHYQPQQRQYVDKLTFVFVALERKRENADITLFVSER